jgi:hypothetical protein
MILLRRRVWWVELGVGPLARHWLRLAGCLALAAGVSACAETNLTNTLGVGKNIPDASQVPTNQALTMPPDLQLRPPGSQPAASAQAAVPGAPIPEPPTEYSSQQVGQPLALETAQEGGIEPMPAPAPQPVQTSQYPQTAAANVDQPAQAAQPVGDVYERYGISKVNPDGTPKSPGQLREELRQKQIAENKAKNPNYGTIFNMGSIWSDQ